MSNSLQPHGQYSLCHSPGQNTGVGSHSFLQGIFPNQGMNQGLPCCRQILYQLSHKGRPRILEWVAYPFSSGSFWPRNQTRVFCIVGGFFTNWQRELDNKECRLPKDWCLWNVVLEKTPESPMESKEIKPVNLKGNQPWISTGRTDAEAQTLVFWSSNENSWLIGKVPDAGKDWGKKEKRASEDEMARWRHWCNGYELGQTSGDGEGQRGLVCYSTRGCTELEMIGWQNNNNILIHI